MVPKWPTVKVGSLKIKFIYIHEVSFQTSKFYGKAILEPMGVKLTSVAHLKGLIILYWNLVRPEGWQNFYYGPRPLEKGHFAPKNGYCAVYCEYSCITRLRDL